MSEFFNDLKYRIKSIVAKVGMAFIRYAASGSNYKSHAAREFLALGYTPLDQPQEDDPNKWIQENLFDLLAVFSTQGHSGSSAPYCANMFKKLALFEPVAPLTGEDFEWSDPSELDGETLQNKRCSHVFKDKDGRVYDSQGRVFREPNGCCYTSKDSRVYIDFPYIPKTEYMDVPES